MFLDEVDEVDEVGVDEQATLLRAMEEKRFLPVGSDKKVEADIQLIAGTHRDLQDRVAKGLFREDLLARINLWTFQLPGLCERAEDIEPNLEFERDPQSTGIGQKTSLTREARREFLDWAMSLAASWSANFRDLTAAVTRMTTLPNGKRLRVSDVREEIQRLTGSWNADSGDPMASLLLPFFGPQQMETIDFFDQAQLATVLSVCQQEKSLAAAGRKLFAASRQARATTNDSDRLRKYLAKFGLDWKTISDRK